MGAPVEVTQANFKKVVEDSKIPVLVDFWAPWCGPCRMVAPVIEELAKEYEGKVSFAKVNVDENAPLSSRYGIMSIPTLIVFKEGKPAQQIVGFKPKPEFKSILDGHLSK